MKIGPWVLFSMFELCFVYQHQGKKDSEQMRTFHPSGIVNPSHSMSTIAFLKEPKMGGKSRKLSRATCHVCFIFMSSNVRYSTLYRFPLAHYVKNVLPRVIIYTELSRIMGRKPFLSEFIKFTFKSELYLFSYNLSLGFPSDFGNFLCNLKF